MKTAASTRATLALAALATSLLLSGCAASAPRGPLERSGSAAEPRPVNVIMRDYVFQPTPIELVPGETVRFNIINGGLLPHEFVLGDRGVQAAWASAEAAATPPVPFATPPPASVPPTLAGLRVYLRSGEQSSVTYEVPAQGELLLACQIPGHVDEGMVGQVRRVRVGAPPTEPGRDARG